LYSFFPMVVVVIIRFDFSCDNNKLDHFKTSPFLD